MTERYIVIGAGILGASAAYHLRKAGKEVTVIDRNDDGQATAVAAGIICPWLSLRRNKRWYRLASGGARYYPELVRELEDMGETNTGYKQVGAIKMHQKEEKARDMYERALAKKEYTPEMGEVTYLDHGKPKEYFPPLDEAYAGVHVSGAARVNGREVRDALIRAGKKLGVTFVEGSAELLHKENRVCGASVDGTHYEADQVIAANGAWAKELLSPLGLHVEAGPQKALIAHLDMPGADTGNWPVLLPPGNKYMLTFEDGRIVSGATQSSDEGFDHGVRASLLQEIISKMIEVAPGLENMEFHAAKIGFRPYTPGSMPVYGKAPGVEGLYIANGLGASGLTAGPYIGAELARLVIGEETELDPSDYTVEQIME
ncbi:oxidoreductase [Salimicrobium jeotgali]|uniref:Oxidoreductase n=1 Tax=Salimicrobium jeotgali TaxID=1230341 RepID=K2H5H5_9BACI|nr:FAD-binding oxidoreductase [Salimicrobium jeotgali]AKG05454.1 oxidoreductase [Salimicrobium jeotgali]EKE31080.1 FAD dependent oxidoreductase [Salimicrobium jeotgali]MBM7697362.1 D-amino-acid dehydrogenase [Salimicrobium jeotgali]